LKISIRNGGRLEQDTSTVGCSLPTRSHGGQRSIYKSKEEVTDVKPWNGVRGVPERRMYQAKAIAIADTNQTEITLALFEEPLRDICPL